MSLLFALLTKMGVGEGLAKVLSWVILLAAFLGVIWAVKSYAEGLQDRALAAERKATQHEERAKNLQAQLVVLNQQIEIYHQESERVARLAEAVDQAVSEIRADREDRRRVYEDHDFTTLFQARSDTMLRLFNSGTRRMLKRLAAAASASGIKPPGGSVPATAEPGPSESPGGQLDQGD